MDLVWTAPKDTEADSFDSVAEASPDGPDNASRRAALLHWGALVLHQPAMAGFSVEMWLDQELELLLDALGDARGQRFAARFGLGSDTASEPLRAAGAAFFRGDFAAITAGGAAALAEACANARQDDPLACAVDVVAGLMDACYTRTALCLIAQPQV